jgi:hypothetical protein
MAQARIEAADAYAREFKDAARALRQAAVAFLKVADHQRIGLGFEAVIPAAPEEVARLRELAELACRIVFAEAVDA